MVELVDKMVGDLVGQEQLPARLHPLQVEVVVQPQVFHQEQVEMHLPPEQVVEVVLEETVLGMNLMVELVQVERQVIV
tara:strand:- start:93 stop:326 length:234 start_codon:yes stop_codon:yes gene_type:complete